jgi:hypothetical protein
MEKSKVENGGLSEKNDFFKTEVFLEANHPSIIDLACKYPILRQYELSKNKPEDLISLYAHSFLDNLLNPKTPINFVKEFRKFIKYQKPGVIPVWWTINNMAKDKVPFLSLLKKIVHSKKDNKEYRYTDKDIKLIITFINNSLTKYEKNNETAQTLIQSNKFNQVMADVLMVNIVWIINEREKSKYNSKYGTFFAEKFVYLESKEKLLCALYGKGYSKLFKEVMYKARRIKDTTDYKEKLKKVLGYINSLANQPIPNDKAFDNSFFKVLKDINNVYPM